MRTWLIGGVAGGLILFLMACASTGTAPDAMAARYTSTTLPVISSAAQATVEAAQVRQYLDQIQAQQTLDAYHAIQTATAQVAAARATATMASQRATATRQSIAATATVWAATVQAEIVKATATAQAAQAQATATQAAFFVGATATAQTLNATATGHARSLNATATVVANVATATAQAAATTDAYESAVREEQLTRERLETRRAELVQPLKAYGPWAILLAAVGLLGVAFWRFAAVLAERQRVIETVDGPLVVWKGHVGIPRNNWGPIIEHLPQAALPTPEQQTAVTSRAQKIQAIKATHPPEGHGRASQTVQRQAMQLLGRPEPAPQSPGFNLGAVQPVRRLGHAAQMGLITAQLGGAIEQDWQKNVIEGEYREV